MKTRMEPGEVIERSKSLFGKHGFKKVTMTDIASAVQISRPTLYSLFPDKESVFAACILSHISEFRSEVVAEISRAKSAQARLRLVFEIYIVKPFNWYFESEAYDMLVNASLYAPDEMAVYWKDFEEALRAILVFEKRKRGPLAKDIAKILVSFARDIRNSAKNLRELERLIDSAIRLALAS